MRRHFSAIESDTPEDAAMDLHRCRTAGSDRDGGRVHDDEHSGRYCSQRSREAVWTRRLHRRARGQRSHEAERFLRRLITHFRPGAAPRSSRRRKKRSSSCSSTFVLRALGEEGAGAPGHHPIVARRRTRRRRATTDPRERRSYPRAVPSRALAFHHTARAPTLDVREIAVRTQARGGRIGAAVTGISTVATSGTSGATSVATSWRASAASGPDSRPASTTGAPASPPPTHLIGPVGGSSVVPSRQVGSPEPFSISTLTTALSASIDCTVILSPPAGLVKLSPTLKPASFTPPVPPGCMSSNHGRKPALPLAG